MGARTRATRHEHDIPCHLFLLCLQCLGFFCELRDMNILTIVGPTAAGKTDLAIEIAERISGEIISADSRQIFKYLDIGTAKPSAKQRRKIEFHLIDFVKPDEDYSCGQFARDAVQKIEDIRNRNRVPIVCGGTGLYIRALFHPLHELPQSDKKTKIRLSRMLDTHGIEYMYKKLQRVDPVWAKKITPQDKQRILRGLEVYQMTGKSLTTFIGKKKTSVNFHPYYIGLNMPRVQLYEKINQRFDQMIEKGLIKEVKMLLARGFSPKSSALRTIGYKEIIEYLKGLSNLDEAIDKAKRRTRNYAKRQITWFSKIPGLRWYNPDVSISVGLTSLLDVLDSSCAY
jgi:tRNA dimethylallyltransferase